MAVVIPDGLTPKQLEKMLPIGAHTDGKLSDDEKSFYGKMVASIATCKEMGWWDKRTNISAAEQSMRYIPVDGADCVWRASIRGAIQAIS